MAKGSISRTTTPEENKLNRGNPAKISLGKPGSSNNRGDVYSQQRRVSTGTFKAIDNTIRNSTEKLDSSNNHQKPIPHYLRASTGSCHDFCKYGKKNKFESKERIIVPKTTGKLKLPSDENKVVVNQKVSSSHAKSFSPYPPEIIKQEIVLPSKNNEIQSSVQLKTETMRLSSSPKTSAGISGEGRRSCIVVKNGVKGVSKASVKKPLVTKLSLVRTSSVKSRKPVSLKVMSSLKEPDGTRNSEVKRSNNEKIKTPEKTLHVIKTDDPVSQSRQSPSALAKKDGSEVDGSPVRLKFGKGKEIDLKSGSNSTRRLRFRRGRVLPDDEDSKGDLRSKSFKNGMVNDDKTDANPPSEKVVLKHQEVAKKDEQGLLNNVIEETASRLVESRKSKVKALVGAFETVISLSLQGRKPPPNRNCKEEK